MLADEREKQGNSSKYIKSTNNLRKRDRKRMTIVKERTKERNTKRDGKDEEQRQRDH